MQAFWRKRLPSSRQCMLLGKRSRQQKEAKPPEAQAKCPTCQIGMQLNGRRATAQN